ncbi:MAG: radical SAM protein [Euryarchaeota archaeon]|nr:radical SAM protein [Euryarchaeota archaeon]
MKVNEIFYSLQGEGAHVGLPTVFVRCTACNLRCAWCDSEYSFYEGKDMELDEIFRSISHYPTRHMCFTGGEPLLQRDALDFMMQALDRGYDIVLETGGSLDISAVDRLTPREKVIISLDVKCPASKMEQMNRWKNIPILRAHDQLKFVVADETDYAFARGVIAKHPSRARIHFQPVWGKGLKWLAERVLADGIEARVGTQLHKHIWGEARGR